jgi:hypothetical protein
MDTKKIVQDLLKTPLPDVGENEPMETTGEKLSGRFRKHDIRWTVPIYVIAEVLIKPNSPPLYQVKGTVGKNKIYPTAYTRNQLQVVN